MPGAGAAGFLAALDELEVNTVCREAACPNAGVCFSKRQLSFLILGKNCTRGCGFCNMSGRSRDGGDRVFQDSLEPVRVSAVVRRLRLKYAVITSVTRDDLPDGGAAVFAETVKRLRELPQGIRVELLVPDLKRSFSALETVLEQMPEVIGHNLDTVPALYNRVKPGSDFSFSLSLLRRIKERRPKILTKSSLMLGMGEKEREVLEALRMLREARCDILTLGQYLPCSKDSPPAAEFITPGSFEEWGMTAREMGFKAVFSGPLVRSSFMAETLFSYAENRRLKFGDE